MAGRYRGRIAGAFLLCGLGTPCFGAGSLLTDDPALNSPAQKEAPNAFAEGSPKPVLNWGKGKSYSLAVIDIIAFDVLLNRFDRQFIDKGDYNVGLDSWRRNIGGKWVVDNDPFAINQFGHPYQGSMYHGFARSAGLSYWESSAATMLGSLFWEIAGETTPPSINDQFTTGLGGSFLGEPLFRMASLLLESSSGRPGVIREIAAALISPATGINRAAHGERFDGVFRSHAPAVYTRVQLGVNVNTDVSSDINANRTVGGPAIPQSYRRGDATADLTIGYGLPGKPDYRYDRPFDYFHFQFTASTANVFENIITRGLLLGEPYSVGDGVRGVWGLYGSYDYISPQIFRVSTTSGGIGTINQWWLSRTVALQSTALVSVGYGSAGAIRGAGERDYHNGIAPQGLLTSRLIIGDRLSLEATLRDYYVSGFASRETSGSENIARAEIALTARIYNLHGLTVKYTLSRRDTRYDDTGRTRQTVGALSLAYSLLGQTRFGAVDWRPTRDAQR